MNRVKLLVLCGAAAAALGAGPVKIMPLGDSITDGYAVPGGYRITLWTLAQGAGWSIDFVGSQSNGPAALPDKDHEGHGGWNIDGIANNIVAWLGQSQPDVILLMIGTNDMLYGSAQADAQAPARLAALLDTILARRPAADLLVASIPPLYEYQNPGVPSKVAEVNAYNAQIPVLVNTRHGQGKKIRFVDVFPSFSAADLRTDGIHPTEAGFAKLANILVCGSTGGYGGERCGKG